MSLIIKGLENNIITKRKLAVAVEDLVAHHNMTYLEALSYIIEMTGFDPVNIKRVLHKSIRDKLQEEAIELRLVKTKAATKLPGIE